jgi:hypothetical protein
MAKNNRERKKEEIRELQDSVSFLKRKNQALQNELNMRPSFLVNDRHLSLQFDSEFTSTIMSVLDQLRRQTGTESTAFYVINAASHFFPVICASFAFTELTGYTLHEIVGQNCGFLSGPQTSRNEVPDSPLNVVIRLYMNTLLLGRGSALTTLYSRDKTSPPRC